MSADNTSGLKRKASQNVSFCVKKERGASYKQIAKIVQKDEKDRTPEEAELLLASPDVVQQVHHRMEKRKQIQDRSVEKEDDAVVLEEKCRKLAGAIRGAENFVVYSGAGVSTAASIPDYRGTNGIWTLLQQGKEIGEHDLTLAEPTVTHMALYSLFKEGILTHVVSQNCDGLHLRSGLPRKHLSEVHGNMYLEVCTKCNVQVWRDFDVTEHTGRYCHKTSRRCSQCCEPLRDTIVHFGERGSLPWPLNWTGACQAAESADVILAMGSSLKVLKKYPWLWGMDKPVKKRPRLYIVNLQWTPKDYTASLKINGRCDEVMKMVMSHLGLEIPKYDRRYDPIFYHATKLHPLEAHTISSHLLVPPDLKPSLCSFDFISDQKIQNIVTEIKRENELEVKRENGIWRPFNCDTGETSEDHFPSTSEVDEKYETPIISSIPLTLDVFDHVYSEITKKIIKETNTKYYNELFGEPLDLSVTRADCEFCFANFSAQYCVYYKKRETRLPPTGPVCFCCDLDDDANSVDTNDTANDKKPVNPGWFGKGYKKRVKKRR